MSITEMFVIATTIVLVLPLLMLVGYVIMLILVIVAVLYVGQLVYHSIKGV